MFIITAIASHVLVHSTRGPDTTLDETAWRAVCMTTAAEAQRGCGLSWDYCVELFSAQIDAYVQTFPESQRAQCLQIAEALGYATPAQRLKTEQWNAEHGYCSHGIELGCCPAGCGSY